MFGIDGRWDIAADLMGARGEDEADRPAADAALHPFELVMGHVGNAERGEQLSCFCVIEAEVAFVDLHGLAVGRHSSPVGDVDLAAGDDHHQFGRSLGETRGEVARDLGGTLNTGVVDDEHDGSASGPGRTAECCDHHGQVEGLVVRRLQPKFVREPFGELFLVR